MHVLKHTLIELSEHIIYLWCFCVSPFHTHTRTHSANFRDEDGSDDNRSSSLGRSAPSDDASVASDYQDDGAPECELTIVLILIPCVCISVCVLERERS